MSRMKFGRGSFIKKIIDRIAIRYCVKEQLLPSIFVRTDFNVVREIFNLPFYEYGAQLNQDVFALFMNNFRKGFYLEIGANDGYTLSNTVYLEEKFGWTGILIEANPRYADTLSTRESTVVVAAVSEEAGEFQFCDAGLYGGVLSVLDPTHRDRTNKARLIKVEGKPLSRILKESDSPSYIDFVSVDVEGGELSIVKQLCTLKNIRFRCGCIEHNYRDGEAEEISKVLTDAGYKIVWENKSAHDLFFTDNITK